MTDRPTETERAELYLALLVGMARDIRDAPGSCDRIGHEWSKWARTELKHDRPNQFLPIDANGMCKDEIVRTKSERHCHQCGAHQVD